MSVTVGSLSSGSIGPRPGLSSMISATKASSSCALSAMRSASTYCATSAEICRRTSPSDTFSIAERLISSMRRRCRRTLASSSLSRSGETEGVDSEAGASSLGSSATICRLGASTEGSSDIAGGGALVAAACASAMRRVAVKRPNIATSAHQRELALGFRFRRLRSCLLLGREDHLGERLLDIVAGLHFFERHTAVDRLADEAEIIRDGAGKRLAERALDVGAAQARPEQALLEAVHDHFQRRAVRQPLANDIHQMARVLEARHGHLGDEEQAI